MKAFLKVLTILVGVIFVFICIFILMVIFANPDNYKSYFVHKFEEVIGQKLIVNGPISLSFIPLPHLKLDEAKIIINVKDTDLEISAETLSFYIPWKSIFSATKTINSIKANNLNIEYFDKHKLLDSFHIDSVAGDVDISYLHIDLTNIELESGKNKVEGKLLLFLEKDVELTGSFQSKEITVPIASENLQQSFAGFLSKLYQLQWLKNVSGHVDFNIQKINFEDTLVEDSHFVIELKDKIFKITTQGKSVKGDFLGKIIIQKKDNDEMPVITTDFKINNQATFDTMEGQLSFEFGQKLPEVKGKIKIKRWDASFFLNENDFITMGDDDTLQGNLNFQIDNLILQKINIENANVDINKKDASLTIDVKGTMANGGLTSHLVVKNETNHINNKVKMEINLTRANASEVIKLFHSDVRLEGGLLDVSFQGDSIGNSLSTLMANLSGKSNLYLKNMTLLNQNFDMRHVNIFAAIFKSFQTGSQDTTLECIAWHFDIKDGVAKANNSIALETRDIYALGTGSLTLQTKKLDFAFELHPRSQMNLGSMENIIFLKGTLDSPQLKTSTQGIVREGGSIVLGIATGGVSLLAEKLLKIATHRSTPCKEVLLQ